MTFNAVLSDCSVFRDGLCAISELISEGIFVAKEDGIYFTATDPTMVTLVDFKMLSMVFDEYKVKGSEEISVNIDSIISVLKRAKSTDKVTLELDKGSNKLGITLKGNSTRAFKIPLLDIEKNDVPEMKLTFPATVELNTSVLSESIADASIVTDTVVLSATSDTFSIIADGDMSNLKVDLNKGSPDVIGLSVTDDASAKYSLDYLKKIEKGSKLADTVKIMFGKDYPAKFLFRTVDKVEISYVLAPRVDD